MIWEKSWRADPDVRPLADRHYNRQKIGAKQFAPPGRCLVLKYGSPVSAFWITSWPFAKYVKHRWAGAWVCSAFRREAGPLASAMIRDAVAATRWYYGTPPEVGLISFVDRDKTRSKAHPGRCYLAAGFEYDGESEGGLICLRMRAENMPPPKGLPNAVPHAQQAQRRHPLQVEAPSSASRAAHYPSDFVVPGSGVSGDGLSHGPMASEAGK